MDEKTKDEIEKLIEKMQCPYGCRCYKTNIENICKARIMGVTSLLECLEEHPENCSFSFRFGGTYFCKCELRHKIAEILGK